MEAILKKMLNGYKEFRNQYVLGEKSIMHHLSSHGQKPEIMVIACCDSRVDPALILQCDPGDLFIVRNVANIVPPYELDDKHHGTSAALEFAIKILNVKHLILLGHSQCGGIEAFTRGGTPNDFIDHWVSILNNKKMNMTSNVNDSAKEALHLSYENCFTFPWIKEKVQKNLLMIHRWFFDIRHGEIFAYSNSNKRFMLLLEEWNE